MNAYKFRQDTFKLLSLMESYSIIALTGSVGCGKTAVLKELSEITAGTYVDFSQLDTSARVQLMDTLKTAMTSNLTVEFFLDAVTSLDDYENLLAEIQDTFVTTRSHRHYKIIIAGSSQPEFLKSISLIFGARVHAYEMGYYAFCDFYESKHQKVLCQNLHQLNNSLTAAEYDKYLRGVKLPSLEPIVSSEYLSSFLDTARAVAARSKFSNTGQYDSLNWMKLSHLITSIMCYKQCNLSQEEIAKGIQFLSEYRLIDINTCKKLDNSLVEGSITFRDPQFAKAFIGSNQITCSTLQISKGAIIGLLSLWYGKVTPPATYYNMVIDLGDVDYVDDYLLIKFVDEVPAQPFSPLQLEARRCILVTKDTFSYDTFLTIPYYVFQAALELGYDFRSKAVEIEMSQLNIF